MDETVLNRVRKLLALTAARGATEHEAATALALAKLILAKHNLALADVRRSKSAAGVVHRSTPLDPVAPAWQKLLADSVARHHFCALLEDAPLLHFTGRPDNLAVAVELYLWTKAQLSMIALSGERQAKLEETWTRGWKSAFLVGAASRIEQRLTDQRLPADATALVRLADADNRRYMKRKFGRIRYLLPRVPRVETAHDAGWNAGATVDIQGRQPTLDGRRMLSGAV